MGLKRIIKEFSIFEIVLWSCSCIALILLFIVNSQRDVITLIASLIGVTALIFIAKGNVIGQIFTVVFSIFYAIVSYKLSYYGEMITYLGMTAPMALLSAISWLRHPYSEEKNVVEISSISIGKCRVIFICTIVVTCIFYFILDFLGTSSLFVSTISIATSFIAASLMFFRSPYYAIAYASNDIVLIILWIMATINEFSYLPMVLCFVIFFVNDIYGFINWRRIRKKQKNVAIESK